ncbi:transcriptional activator protein FnrL [Aliiroseovarius zhejiangensis]|uniref:Transcriptional activator protein FnrL n=1 Tax=Aliiroseovarius zhejiangensis TaxID=1632025 RepID=A0ABQ3IYR0_9RHOB|nr:Crp/Fnr family transcriptional regulator [Aliiroseovarius zhejiangensis]GHE97960.1 transcriptional activator protein FnrL [Aliiroseovarius zhejiangensis]
MNDISFNTRDCGSCPIRHRAVCARCQPDELEQLDAIKYYRTFEAGQPVIWSGDPMEFVSSVVSGIATLSQTMEDGRTQMVGLLLPSDFIGRPGRDAAPFDVVAVTDLTLCCFRKKPFEDMMEKTPAIGTRLLQMTLDELDSAREWMLVLGRKTAREKIASLLAILARRDASLHKKPPRDGMSFELPLTREAMADYLGLTLETVSRQVSALKKTGVVELQGKRRVTIPDLQALITETGDDVDGAPIV